MPNRLAYLDSLRAVAITAVFWYHALFAAFARASIPFDASDPLILLWPVSVGWFGVAVFFAVSGFCIHLSYLKSSGRFTEYFIRRFFRIYPPYLFALLLLCAINYPGHHQFITHLLLIHNLSRETLYAITGAFWSIATEAQLYLVYPLLVIGARRYGWDAVIVAALAIEVALRSWACFDEVPTFIEWGPGFFVFSWSIGAYVAHLICEGKVPTVAKGWTPTILIYLAAYASEATPMFPFAFLLFALGTAALILKLHSREFVKFPFTGIGRDSYSFYLLHQPMLSVLLGAIPWLPRSVIFLVGGVCIFVVVAVVSRAMRILIEDPSTALGKTVAQKLYPKPQRIVRPFEIL